MKERDGKMERIHTLMGLPEYQKRLKELENLEEHRIYCRHGLVHLLDVARIAYISALEEHCDIAKDIIYATALLHDLGRIEEYQKGESHHIASEAIAKRLLPECGYSKKETDMIVAAIGEHRDTNQQTSDLSRLLYEADKRCRLCFACEATGECYWPEDKKNKGLYR